MFPRDRHEIPPELLRKTRRGCRTGKQRKEETLQTCSSLRHHGNVRSLPNRTDELGALTRYQREYRESSILLFTETWLTPSIPDSTVMLDNFHLLRADRTADSDCILKDRTEEKIAGSSPKPSVTILHQTKNWALLECEVQDVFPKPKVQWLDSDHNRVPAEEPHVTENEGKYNIILKTTVTKSDVYRCVSTQEEICHQIDQRIYVHLLGGALTRDDFLEEKIEEARFTTIRVTENEDVILPCSLNSTNISSETFDWKTNKRKKVFQYVSGNHSNNGRGGQDPQFKGRVFHFEDQLQSGNASIEIKKTKKTDSGNYRCIFPHRQGLIKSIIELIVDKDPGSSTGWIIGLLLVGVLVLLAVLVKKDIISLNCNKGKPEKPEEKNLNDGKADAKLKETTDNDEVDTFPL